MPVKIKFCGLTRPEDVRAALALGVDAIGLNLAHGRRKLTVEQAAALARAVPPPVMSVALFVDAAEDVLLAAMAATRCSAVQLHGDEKPELAERLRARFPVIKAFAVRDAESLRAIDGYPADAYLLDSAGGGSGQPWDLAWAEGMALSRPVILAGGLRPDTVAAAAARLRPWAVDVSSGIESAPGIKDAELMRRFVAACHG